MRVSEIDKHKDLPVIEKDSKRIVAITEIVTKAELQEALSNIHVEGGQYDDSEILKRLRKHLKLLKIRHWRIRNQIGT